MRISVSLRVVLNQGNFVPSRGCFWCGVLLEPRGQSSGMLLNTLQSIGSPYSKDLAQIGDNVEIEELCVGRASGKPNLPFSNIHYFSRLNCFSGYNNFFRL